MAKFPDPSSSCPLPFIFFFNFNNDPLNYDPHDLPLNCKYNMSYTGPWDLIIQIKNQDLEIQLLSRLQGLIQTILEIMSHYWLEVRL